jgi:type III secretion system low calcium response chaperone LcrH/SycD
VSETLQPAPATAAFAARLFEHIAMGGTLSCLTNFGEREHEAIYRLGHALYTQHQFADASKVFGFLALSNHQERRYVQAYAASLQMTGDHAGALEMYRLAYLLDPMEGEPCLHMCECLIALGRKDEAIEGLTHLTQLGEGDAPPELRERAQSLLALITRSNGVATPKESS